MSKFSAGLRISNVDDFLAPSQECIKPVKINKTIKTSKIIIGDDGEYFGEGEDGNTFKLEKAKISLDDCLACSGCITTAEEILIQEQSAEEFLRKVSELKNDPNYLLCLTLSPQSRASLSARFNLGNSHESFLKLKHFFKSLGIQVFIDSTFGRELSLSEISLDFFERLNQNELPVISSACPGWVCFAEKHKKNKQLVPLISRAKSPQQIMGSLLKRFLVENYPDYQNKTIYHACIMPCFDKKLEGSRPEFRKTDNSDEDGARDVDIVVSTMEIEEIILRMNPQFLIDDTNYHPVEVIFSTLSKSHEAVYCHSGSSSGGYLDYTLRDTVAKLHGINLLEDLSTDEHIEIKRTNKNYQEINFYADPSNSCVTYRFVYAYGLKNIQKVVDNMFRRKMKYHFIEMMACPGGCLNGGGQIRCNEEEGEGRKRVSDCYNDCDCQCVLENEAASRVYEDVRGSHNYKDLVHTTYNVVEQIDIINPTITNW